MESALTENQRHDVSQKSRPVPTEHVWLVHVSVMWSIALHLWSMYVCMSSVVLVSLSLEACT